MNFSISNVLPILLRTILVHIETVWGLVGRLSRLFWICQLWSGIFEAWPHIEILRFDVLFAPMFHTPIIFVANHLNFLMWVDRYVLVQLFERQSFGHQKDPLSLIPHLQHLDQQIWLRTLIRIVLIRKDACRVICGSLFMAIPWTNSTSSLVVFSLWQIWCYPLLLLMIQLIYFGFCGVQMMIVVVLHLTMITVGYWN